MTGPKRTMILPPVDLRPVAAMGARLLKQVGGHFALVGGLAMQAYGSDRITKDVDFAVTELQGAQAAARWPGQTRPLNIGGVALITDTSTIDLIDRRVELRALFIESIDAAVRSGFTTVAEGEEMLVVPAEYLVAMKMAGARHKDEADIGFLMVLPSLDYRRARDIVHRHLGFFAARHLDRMARSAGRTDAPRAYDEEE